jgi:uncharacterized protein (TIGR01440 family)
MSTQQIVEQITLALQEFADRAKPSQGQIFVVGCSTSEVLGKHIGKGSSLEVAKALFGPIEQFASQHGLYLAFQCCEHLNRALVVSRACQERYQLTEVSAIPQPGAGGSMATVGYVRLPDACLVEHIQGHMGFDIGDTFIGMHLRPVAIPVRLGQSSIGAAHLTAARTRPKLIGGERAVYKQTEGVMKSCL